MSNIVQKIHQLGVGVLHGSKPVQTPQDYHSPTFHGRIAELVVFNLPYGGVSSYPSQSAVTSATGHSVRTPAKKQIRSTSQSYSRRKYYYGKKRKY